jgi:hypothetical protein
MSVKDFVSEEVSCSSETERPSSERCDTFPQSKSLECWGINVDLEGENELASEENCSFAPLN